MKIKGMLFILFAACVGHIGAMEPDKKVEDPILKLVTKQLPPEIGELIFAKKIDQILKAPFPKEELINFAQNYLSLITQFPMNTKKHYLNEFAKKWYLAHGRKLKIPASWIEKHFPGQTPKQVLDYGFSIQDYLNSPVLQKEIQVTTYTGKPLLNLQFMKINNLQGLQNIPNIKTVKILYLMGNQLTTIPDAFAGLTNLEKLYLYSNQLTTIQAGAFAGLTNLKELYLNNNLLTTIPDAFAGLTNLVVLYLDDNQLTAKAKEAIRKALPDVEIDF